MDPAFRDKQETTITRRLTKVFSDQRKRLARGGRDEGWDQFTREFRDAIADKLQETYENSAMLALLLMVAGSQQAQEALQRKPIEFDGSKYAQQRADRLARDIEKRMREAMREIEKQRQAEIEQAEKDGIKPPSDRLKPTDLADDLGPQNAETIGITETTAAGTEGELDARTQAEKKLDITVTVTWSTEKDSLVCPICRPLDGTTEDQWGEKFRDGPPAHPRCRCELRYVTQR